MSVIAFENQNDAAGITANGHDKMTLVDTAVDVLGETDLYLGIQGMDSGSSGLTMVETSLTKVPAVLGTLNSKMAGEFKFVGAVGTGFVDRYEDSTFPVSGATIAEVQAYMDGTSSSGSVNARAKYALRFKLEHVPLRRSSSGSPSPSP